MLTRLALVLGLATLTPICHAAINVPSGSSINLASSFNGLACTPVNVLGNLLGTSYQIDRSSSVNVGAGGVFDGASATIEVSGGWSNAGSFLPGTSQVTFSDRCNATTLVSGDTTFYDLTITSTNGHLVSLLPGAVITVLNSLTIEGTPSNPVTIGTSGSYPPATIIVARGATSTINHAVIAPGLLDDLNVPKSIPALSPWMLVLLAIMLLGISVKYHTNRPTSQKPLPAPDTTGRN